LAIEMAAARLKVLTPSQVAQRLKDRFRLLTGTTRTALSRHQTLRATLDWSHDLLTQQEKVLLRRLAVVSDGCTLEAAEAVCSDDALHPEETLDLLDHLVSKSMIQADATSLEARYRLLETIRQYALDRLIEAGECEAFRRRHLEFFLAFARAIEPQLRRAKRGQGFDRLEKEHNNIRSVLISALENEDWLEPGVELASSVRLFWWLRGHLNEGRAFFQRALANEALMKQDRTKALANHSAALLAFCQTDYQASRDYCERALKLFEQIDDAVFVARSLNILGNVAKNLGQPDSALKHYRQCLAIGDDLNDVDLRRVALNNLGELALWRRQYGVAQTYLEQSLSIAREVEDEQHVAWCSDKLSQVALGTGDIVTAEGHLRTSLLIANESEDKRALTYALEGFARLFVAQGHLERAALIFGKTNQLRDQLAMPLHVDERGRHEEAIAACRQGLGERFDDLCKSGSSMSKREAIDLTHT
jgi:tetratricopeptide (TPR) repeat protein